jgi:predicted GNAT family acetyltransferase
MKKNKLIKLSKALSNIHMNKEAVAVLSLTKDLRSYPGNQTKKAGLVGDILALRNFKTLPKEKKLEIIHNLLKHLGKVPAIGTLADMLNVVLYLAEGQPIMAVLSAISLIPGFPDFLADAAKTGKEISPKIIVDNATRILDVVNKIAGRIQEGNSLIQAAQTLISEAKGGKGIAANLVLNLIQRTSQSKGEVSS